MENTNIKIIQNYLKKQQIEAYLFFLSDDHGSEYISKNYQIIPYLTNFTGSNATLLVLQDKALMWTDGRYFLQASKQLASNVTLMKIGLDESLNDYIVNNVSSIMFNFKLASCQTILTLLKNKPTLKLIDETSFIKTIWSYNDHLTKKIFLLPEKEVFHDVIYNLHHTLSNIHYAKNYGVLVSSLDDIAYLLNARGHDIPYNPIFNSYLFLSKINQQETYTLYIKKVKLTTEITNYFNKINLKIKPYNQIYKDIAKFKDVIFYDSNKTNYKLYSLMALKKEKVLYPTIKKTIKNSLAIKQTKKIHLLDAIAMCKFIYFVKTHAKSLKLDELSLAKYLRKLRLKQGAFDESFATIMAYLDHGAIIHYNATKETNAKIKDEGFLLVDSGGQYYYGTTDITRTIVLGNITPIMKRHFTLVLKAHIALASAKFIKGTTDASLDLIARKPLWDEKLDYNHGTGHGVGHMLNVHEGPISIRYNKACPTIMKKGMITSDEPGLYLDNQYGIRHENELLCCQIDQNHLGFEPLTYVPFDLKAIDTTLLSKDEISYLNDYHQMVYNKVYKYLTKKEQKYLKEATRKI